MDDLGLIFIGLVSIATIISLINIYTHTQQQQENFLAFYCGIFIFKIFGFQTDIYNNRVPLPPNYPLHPALTRTYVIGLARNYINGNYNTLTQAPCYNVHTYVPSLAAAQNWIISSLRTLATRNPTRKIKGPFITLLANNYNNKQIYIALYAPSHMKNTGAFPPNKDALGHCHRWVNRLLIGSTYGIPDPKYNSSNGSTTYVRTCFNAPETMREIQPCTREYSYVPCGCIGSGCTHYQRYKGDNYSEAAHTHIFVVYEIKMEHPSIAPLIHPESPKRLLRNILPYNTELRPGLIDALISPNGAYALVVSHNRLHINGVPLLTTPTTADNAILDDKEFRLESINGDSMKIALTTGKAETPISIELQNDGRLVAFDRYDMPISSPALDAFHQRLKKEEPSAVPYDALMDPYATFTEYDPLLEYARRIQNLLDYLQARNLLFNYSKELDSPFAIPTTPAPNSPLDYSKFYPYDPRTDYNKRLEDLYAKLKAQGLTPYRDPAPITLPSPSNLSPPTDVAGASQQPFQPYDPQRDQDARMKQLLSLSTPSPPPQ